MVAGPIGRMFQHVMELVVKVLKHRVDIAVNHLGHVVESSAVVLIFNL